MKKIIINADDYGLSEKFNRGIVKLIVKGLVKSTSVMINQKYVFPGELIEFPDLSIGLHLEEQCGQNNLIYFESQINKFLIKFGFLPTHLDGHKHCHLKKENRQATIKLALKYNLPVRSRFKKGRDDLRLNHIKTPDRFIAWHPNKKEDFFSRVNLVNEEIVEIVCHPGYYDKNYPMPYNNQREDELKILSSVSFKKIIDRFELIDYKYLA